MSSQISFPQQLIAKFDLILLLFGVLLASLSPIFIRLSETEISPNAVTFDRYWIAAVVLGISYGLKAVASTVGGDRGIKVSYTIKDIALLSLLAVFIIACSISWTWSLTQTSVANSNLLHNMTPIFAILGGWLFLHHRFNRRFTIGMVITLSGTAVIGIIDMQGAMGDRLTGDALALLSAIFYAGCILSTELLRTKFSATTILLWSYVLATSLMLPFMVFRGERIFPDSWFVWLAVISQAILCNIIGTGLLFHSLKRFSSGFVSLVLLLDPVIAAILATAIFAENLSIVNCLAFGVILTGIYLAKSGKGAEKPEDKSVAVQNN